MRIPGNKDKQFCALSVETSWPKMHITYLLSIAHQQFINREHGILTGQRKFVKWKHSTVQMK